MRFSPLAPPLPLVTTTIMLIDAHFDTFYGRIDLYLHLQQASIRRRPDAIELHEEFKERLQKSNANSRGLHLVNLSNSMCDRRILKNTLNFERY